MMRSVKFDTSIVYGNGFAVLSRIIMVTRKVSAAKPVIREEIQYKKNRCFIQSAPEIFSR